MKYSEKRTYKLGLIIFVIFGVILMIHGLIFGALEAAQSWQHLAAAILISPFIAFGIGFIIPRNISDSQIKHSFLIGLVGSGIFISLTCYLTPGFGSLIGIDPNYSNLIEEIGLGEFISLSIWGIVSSIFTSLLGTIFSSFRESEVPSEEESAEEFSFPGSEPERQQPPAPTPQPNTPAQPAETSSPPPITTQQPGRSQSQYGAPDQQIESPRSDTPAQEPAVDETWGAERETDFPTQSEREEDIAADEDDYGALEESGLEEERSCVDCGQKLRWIEQYEMWYCDYCREYQPVEEEETGDEWDDASEEYYEEDEVDVKLCPHCVSELRWIPQYERWYCDNCQQYVEGIDEEDISEETQEESYEEYEEVEEEEEVTEAIEPCPDCDGEVRWLEEYNRWYCEDCKEYKSIED